MIGEENISASAPTSSSSSASSEDTSACFFYAAAEEVLLNLAAGWLADCFLARGDFFFVSLVVLLLAAV